jgi:glycolate oxidase FAD binding subunit
MVGSAGRSRGAGAGVTALGAAARTLRPDTAAHVADAVRDAARLGEPLRLTGRATWTDAGRPVAASTRLDLSALRGIVAYTPGDLTLTALAGTPLDEIAAATREHGQWLPLDPFGAPTGTLGATLATASAGPLAASVGRPRDVALGITFVSGEGAVVQAGGRVVKNVAGFDLVRLSIGAWGTLGAIVEATVRLRGLPHNDTTFALALPEGREQLATFLRSVRTAPVTALAAEMLHAKLASRVGLAPRDTLLVRVAGNHEAVASQRGVLASVGSAQEVDGAVWSRLASSEPRGAATFRLSRPPAELAALWEAARAAVADRPDALLHATVERGVVRCMLPDADAAWLPRLAAALPPNVRRVAERLPDAAWPSFAPGTANDVLARRLREAFDPARVLNPGILGEASP